MVKHASFRVDLLTPVIGFLCAKMALFIPVVAFFHF